MLPCTWFIRATSFKAGTSRRNLRQFSSTALSSSPTQYDRFIEANSPTLTPPSRPMNPWQIPGLCHARRIGTAAADGVKDSGWISTGVTTDCSETMRTGCSLGQE
jgi:hypothetical protein